jgi:hypothetical protein
METTAAIARLTGPGATISSLQGDAWEAWNASYAAPDRDVYRAVSLALYQQDVHQRITTLFARSDEQNARLDALLRGQ